MYVIELPNGMLVDLNEIVAMVPVPSEPNLQSENSVIVFKSGDRWAKKDVPDDVHKVIYDEYRKFARNTNKKLPEPYAWETKEGDILFSYDDKVSYEHLYNSSANPLWDEDTLSNAGII